MEIHAVGGVGFCRVVRAGGQSEGNEGGLSSELFMELDNQLHTHIHAGQEWAAWSALATDSASGHYSVTLGSGNSERFNKRGQGTENERRGKDQCDRLGTLKDPVHPLLSGQS
jgi:hypothetical protein